MQFSLRRMLLAVAVFAASLGTLTLYAKSLGMFRPDYDPTWWWVAVIATAFGAGSLVLLGHRRDSGRILNTSVWIVAGLIVGSMLSPDYPPSFAIPSGVIGGTGCVLVTWLDSLLTGN
ncbi:MAG: hypothetical protein ACLP9L_29715 [Thermoguttaceae bacterium]